MSRKNLVIWFFGIISCLLLPASGRAEKFSIDPVRNKLAPCVADQPCLRMLWPADPARPGEMVELSMDGAPRPGVIKFAEGEIEGLEIDWQTPSGEVVATSRIAATVDSLATHFFIETTTRKAITAPTGDFNRVHFAFPAVRPPAAQRRVLNYEVDTFCPHKHQPIPTSGPTIMFSNDLDVTIISPLDHFLSSIQQPVGGEYRCGFEGEIQSIPAGTTFKAIITRSSGLNHTMSEWGRALRVYYGTKPADSYADIGLSHLGYWTDNGAYYYYKTEPGMNYHDTLLGVKKYADEQHIPYGYFQLDSWWYPKTNDINVSGETKVRGGAWLWEPMPELFPQGLPAFHEQLGLPLIAHNRWYDSQSPYCKKYGCAIGEAKNFGLPLAPAFWDEIMDNAVRYGVVVYEQDWLQTQYRDIPWLRQGIDRAETWFDNMASAAARRGLTMQLCMASPGFLMQSVKHNNITQVRTSYDYHAYLSKARYWPAFHTANMFAAAVGLWPFKDNFFTTPGQDKAGGEHWPMEEALISVLSAGMVGPGDKIGATDVGLLMKTCRQDGLLLKPDVPALPLDATFVNPGRPLTVLADTNHKIGRIAYLAASNVEPWKTFYPVVTMKELGISGKQVIWDWRKQKLTVGADSIFFGLMPPNNAFYYIITPVLANGMAVIGETDKFVTMASKRFTRVEPVGSAIEMDLAGVAGEEIGVVIYSPSRQPKVTGEGAGPAASAVQPGLYRVAVKFPESGKVSIKVE